MADTSVGFTIVPDLALDGPTKTLLTGLDWEERYLDDEGNLREEDGESPDLSDPEVLAHIAAERLEAELEISTDEVDQLSHKPGDVKGTTYLFGEEATFVEEHAIVLQHALRGGAAGDQPYVIVEGSVTCSKKVGPSPSGASLQASSTTTTQAPIRRTS